MQNPTGANGSLQAGELGAQIWHLKSRILIPTLLVAIAATFWTQGVTPLYKSEVRLLLERSETAFTRPEAEKNQVTERVPFDAEAIASQMQILLSRDVGKQVSERLKLGALREFDPTVGGLSTSKKISALLGIGKNWEQMAPEDRVLENYFQKIIVYPVDKARVLAVEFHSKDPDLAARVANAIIATYFETLSASKQEATIAAGNWLNSEIDELRRKVSEAEARVEGFRANTNLYIGLNNTSLVAQQLGETNSQIIQARGDRTQAEARAKSIRDLLRTGGTLEVSNTLNSDLMRRLTEQRATLKSLYAELTATLLRQHPRLNEVSSQIADINNQIRSEAMRLVQMAENDARFAATRAEQLNGALEQLKKQASATADQDVTLRALEREARSQRDLLESYLGKWREASGRGTNPVTPRDARIISSAMASSTPFFPKPVPTVLIATLATLFIGLGVVATGVVHSGQIAEANQEARRSGGHHEPQPPAPGGGQHTNQENWRVAVRDLVKHLADRNDTRKITRILVTASVSSVDTAAAALALSRELAEYKFRVLLIDGDHQEQVLTKCLALAGATGFGDVLAGRLGSSSAIHRDPGSGAHIMPAGSVPLDSIKNNIKSHYDCVLGVLDANYDHVIVITPSLLASECAADLAPLMGYALLITENAEACQIDLLVSKALSFIGVPEVCMLPIPGVTTATAKLRVKSRVAA